jgi:transposase
MARRWQLKFFEKIGKLAQLASGWLATLGNMELKVPTSADAEQGSLIDQLKEDVRQGRVAPERLLDVIAQLQQALQAAQQRIEELEKKLGGAPPTKLDETFSMRAEEKRQEARGNKKRKEKKAKRRGRLKNAEKLAQAKRTEAIYPKGVDRDRCKLSHVRPVWRLEKGQAVLIAYEIYRGPNKQYGQIPGVLGRSEFGMEIFTEISYLVYTVGLSFDKVCMLLNFFQNLSLSKSQVDALLYQLARHWEHEFDVLCVLLSNSLVVHADETGWSIKSVWAMLSEKARILLFGVNKDAETLTMFLDPETFEGLVFSDDAAVYANFTESQKCWAHLIRKAIKLTLQDPDNADYRALTDGLLEIYHQACQVKRDGRFGDVGRVSKVEELELRLMGLCQKTWDLNLPPLEGLANDHRLLIDELMRLTLNQQLFKFVTVETVWQPNGDAKPVDGTNNEAERTLRNPGMARDTGRANKTPGGARRQTILTSVLESLRVYLPTFTLSSVLKEMTRWWKSGCSCFTELLRQLGLQVPEKAILDRLYPDLSG